MVKKTTKKTTPKKKVKVIMQKWAVDNLKLASMILDMVDYEIITKKEAREMLFIEKPL